MKILQIIDGDSYGGISKIINDLTKNISNIKFDYLTSINLCNNWINLNISRRTLKGKIIYNHRLHKFLKTNNYDVVHINSGVFLFSFQVVLICKLSKIKKIVVHSHSTPNISKFKKIIIKLLNPIFRKLTNVHLACSNEAAKSLFTKTKDVIILKNGININNFKFDEKIRKIYREKLNINNNTVYCHIGSFDKAKNHIFLIDLFNKIHENNKHSILLMIGDGILKKEIEKKVKLLNIQDKVLFLGYRTDIKELLCASDVFLFPSLNEGLGIVLIESQTNGLPVLVSKNISECANISDNYKKINNYDIDTWINNLTINSIKQRKIAFKDTIKSGYDIKTSSKQLEKIYYSLKEDKNG